MGIADIKKAFIQAGGPTVTCTQARLLYDREIIAGKPTEYQYLEFDGHFVANSNPFSIRSDRIAAQGNLSAAAAATAAKLLEQQGAAP
jgi:hypothetical protein